MSNKINKLALQTVFGANAETILTICNATPQPEIAIEIALGIYTPIDCPVKGRGKEGENLTVTSYDPLRPDYDQVRYTKAQTIIRYFRNEEHAKSNDNYYRGGSGTKSESYPFEHTFDSIENCNTDIITWNKYAAAVVL